MGLRRILSTEKLEYLWAISYSDSKITIVTSTGSKVYRLPRDEEALVTLLGQVATLCSELAKRVREKMEERT